MTIDESMMEATLEELRDFMEADWVPVDADPAFKERLRKKLWDLVEARTGRILPRDFSGGDDL